MADNNLKRIVCEAIDSKAEELLEISDSIWKHPELAFEETHAHHVLTEFLEKCGFQTEKSYKLKTAFRATFAGNRPGPNIAFISEYDALPTIGHACGHNLIAEVGVAAGFGLMAAFKASSDLCGRVSVLGTPAEEGAGGKIDLIDAGVFADVDVAMMAHPFPDNDFAPIALAKETIEVIYSGQPSHAAGYPWEGVNALDAAVMCYNGIACLRQQMKPTWRAHCIIKEGGEKINIIPERAVLHVGMRATTTSEMKRLKTKILDIIDAASLATGCKVEHETDDKPYAAVLHNKVMVDLYQSNMSTLQPEPVPTVRGATCGSTDMGDVSQIVPSIHPNFHIGGREVNHTRGFTKDAGDIKAQPFTLTQAKALALTAVDILMKPELMEKIKEEFQREAST